MGNDHRYPMILQESGGGGGVIHGCKTVFAKLSGTCLFRSLQLLCLRGCYWCPSLLPGLRLALHENRLSCVAHTGQIYVKV